VVGDAAECRLPVRVGPEIQALPRPLRLSFLRSPVLVLGAPRSGTTWLAKILDSHPDVLYRHEPDHAHPGPSPLADQALVNLLAIWARDRSARTAGKRPFFAKSFQPPCARLLRLAFAAASRVLPGLPIPDLAIRPFGRLVIKSIGWAQGALVFSRALPHSRTIFVLRHPCGQVASVMAGNRQRRFDLRTAGTDMPFDETSAVAFSGLTDAAFQSLPEAANYAWSWRAFNEPAYAALAIRTNVQIVLYEALCAQPETLAREIFNFLGLDWRQSVTDFISTSTTRPGQTGYYAVFRDAVAAADRWRTRMAAEDQQLVRAVVCQSPLSVLWPDLQTQ